MRDFRWIAAVLAVFAAALAWLMMQPPAAIAEISRENGPVETASAVGFALCALAVWMRTGTGAGTKALVSALMLVLTARELDVDKRFFTRGLFKSSQYLRDDVPFGEKIVSAAILLAILGGLLALVVRERRTLRAALRRWHAGTMALAATVIFAGIAKSLDGIGRKLAPLGIEVSADLGVYLGGVEELMELAIMALLLVAILCWPRGGRQP